jgi:hypothetical protein
MREGGGGDVTTLGNVADVREVRLAVNPTNSETAAFWVFPATFPRVTCRCSIDAGAWRSHVQRVARWPPLALFLRHGHPQPA